MNESKNTHCAMFWDKKMTPFISAQTCKTNEPCP